MENRVNKGRDVKNALIGCLAGIVIGTIYAHAPQFIHCAAPAITALSLFNAFISDPSERMASERVGDMLINLGAIGLGTAGSIAASYL